MCNYMYTDVYILKLSVWVTQFKHGPPGWILRCILCVVECFIINCCVDGSQNILSSVLVNIDGVWIGE
jgi:hypothetical protein